MVFFKKERQRLFFEKTKKRSLQTSRGASNTFRTTGTMAELQNIAQAAKWLHEADAILIAGGAGTHDVLAPSTY